MISRNYSNGILAQTWKKIYKCECSWAQFPVTYNWRAAIRKNTTVHSRENVNLPSEHGNVLTTAKPYSWTWYLKDKILSVWFYDGLIIHPGSRWFKWHSRTISVAVHKNLYLDRLLRTSFGDFTILLVCRENTMFQGKHLLVPFQFKHDWNNTWANSREQIIKKSHSFTRDQILGDKMREWLKK